MSLAGCRDSIDEQMLDFTQNAMDQQSQQARQLAGATEKLIEADAVAREEIIDLQRTLVERDETGRQQIVELQASLDQQRAALEEERRRLANERVRTPIVAMAVANAALMFACVLPLIVAIYALRIASRESFDVTAVNEVLIGEIVQPRIGLQSRSEQRPLLERQESLAD
jgi:hypothetical protein